MRLVLRLLTFELVLAGILFGAAGRLNLPWIWALIAIHATLMLGVMSAIDPELRQERFRPAPGGQDRHFRWIVLPFLLAHLVVAGLDVGRFGWSREVPPTVHAAGLVGVALCLGLVCRAMTANRFFSPVVRIQQERGHHVVMTGPYRYVRHPGYVGGMLAALCGAVVLGSWWSMVPLAPYLLLFVRRAAMEDRFLQRELEGYAEYAKQVRYRLVPGVW